MVSRATGRSPSTACQIMRYTTGGHFEFVVFYSLQGRAIAQAVSGRIPTAAARVRAQVRSCGICGGESGTGGGFLPVLRFPLTILIPPAAQHSSSYIVGG
jgi:hypothetical protein